MARSKSIILSKEEKKAVITGLKMQVKDLQVDLKFLVKDQRAKDKEFDAYFKNNLKQTAAVGKLLASQQAQLSAMTEPTAAISQQR